MEHLQESFSISAFGSAEAAAQARFFESAVWRLSAATATGPSHERRQTLCEDACAVTSIGEWLVAVVCDGAGSAAKGGQGAAIASATVRDELAVQLKSEWSTNQLKADVRGALAAARERLAALAQTENLNQYAFSSTVVGAVARGEHVLFFQIGDGAGMAFGPTGDTLTLCSGRPQEYANETYFLTDETWEESLRFEESDGAASFLLATDGVTPFLMGGGSPKPNFYKPILDFVLHKNAEDSAQALHRLLNREELRLRVHDDKTLLVATSIQQPESLELASGESAAG